MVDRKREKALAKRKSRLEEGQATARPAPDVRDIGSIGPVVQDVRNRTAGVDQERTLNFRGEVLRISLTDINITLASLQRLRELISNDPLDQEDLELETVLGQVNNLLRDRLRGAPVVLEWFNDIVAYYNEILAPRPPSHGQIKDEFLGKFGSERGSFRVELRALARGENPNNVRPWYTERKWKNRDFQRILNLDERLTFLSELKQGKENFERYEEIVYLMKVTIDYLKSTSSEPLDIKAQEIYYQYFKHWRAEDLEALLEALMGPKEDSRDPVTIRDVVLEREKFLSKFTKLNDLETALRSVVTEAILLTNDHPISTSAEFKNWVKGDFEFAERGLERKIEAEKYRTRFDYFAEQTEGERDVIKRRLARLFLISTCKKEDFTDHYWEANEIIDYAKNVLYTKLPLALLRRPFEVTPGKKNYLLELEKIPFEARKAAADSMKQFFEQDGNLIKQAIDEFSLLKGDPNFAEPAPSMPTPPAAPVTVTKTPEEQLYDDLRELLKSEPTSLVYLQQAIFDLNNPKGDPFWKGKLKEELAKILATGTDTEKTAKLVRFLTAKDNPASSLRISIINSP